MSNNFGETLRQLLDYHGKTAMDLCRSQGFNTSHMSQIMRKTQKFIYKEDAAKIAGFFQDQFDQADLLAARLQDECEGPGSRLIEIKVRRRPPGKAAQKDPVRKHTVAPDLARALDQISQRATDDATFRD